MADSDMDISGESDTDIPCRRVRNQEPSFTMPIVPQDMVSLIPMPPASSAPASLSTSNTAKSTSGERSTAYMPLKKRWLQNVEKEPKKRKVSLEAYRKRHVSGGDSGESARSPSDIDNPSSHLRSSVKKEHKLAREHRDRQSGKILQKMTISDLEKRKNKLKKALRQIETSSVHDRTLNGTPVDAKNEFDKFMEKQSRWLEKRAREKQREVKLERFTSSMDLDALHQSREDNHLESSHIDSPSKSFNCTKVTESDLKHSSSRNTDHRNHNIDKRKISDHHQSSEKFQIMNSTGKQKRVAVVRPRGQSELTSTLLCLQKAKEEVQRQLTLLKSPHADNSSSGSNYVKGVFDKVSFNSHSFDKSNS